jgi:hypothetical protein
MKVTFIYYLLGTTTVERQIGNNSKMKKISSIHLWIHVLFSLQTSNGKSESASGRRIDNRMIKRKSTKGQTTIYKENKRSGNTNPTNNRVNSCGPEWLCSTYGIRRVVPVTKPVISHEWRNNAHAIMIPLSVDFTFANDIFLSELQDIL